MDIAGWIVLGLFLFGFIGSCASLGASSSPPLPDSGGPDGREAP